VARAIIEHDWALRAQGIEAVIQWDPGYSGIPGNDEVDSQANTAREDQGNTVCERIHTSAGNRTRWIFEARKVAQADWEAKNVRQTVRI
jgi:hypothetical protein